MPKYVFGLIAMFICRGLLFTLLFAAALRIGEKKGLKAACNNNLPHQIGDVIINPENPVNPDSNNGLLRA